MSTESATLNQQVLHDNKEIYARIESELRNATSQILVAASWFTDDELFDILLLKLSEGIQIELIIADNQENEKLDFSLLSAKGAEVLKIKNVGYGMMHQKFCVIDRRICITWLLQLVN
jgi:phosphatidylserine/phosphatidylglycerophosphate/cardiolipin synthase-like enzyme